MPSLSDSQNIDLGDGSPTLPPSSPLQVCPACEALLDISEREPLEKIACPQCGAEMLVKGEIAHYVITEVAGRGGMGVVYKAYDPSLDRHVAIKLLRKDQSSDQKLIQQLETEAAITASVNDPNVVRVFGTGVDRGRFYLVMELVDKGSLDNLIQLQGRVAEAQVLEVGIHAARGLRAAQQHGLIHRDVKPGNILFADAHAAKIVDFGLAVFQEQEESVRGEIWGTPYYVAPEKLDNQPEDFRSDMYSLGGTLFHALAGRPPFEAENASLVALKHLKSQQVSLQSFAPWVSNGTAHIINRMLNKDPEKRFQSYEELIESLEYALTQLHAHGGSVAPRTRVKLETEEDQKRYTWVILGLAAVVLIVGIAFGLSMWKRNTPVKQVARAAIRTGARYEPLQPAIEAFAAGNKESIDLFKTASQNPSLSPADRAWAELLGGAAMLANGKINESRNTFNHVGESAAILKDKTMGELIADVAQRVKDGRAVDKGLTDRLDTSGHEAAALLIYALNNWRAAKPEDALAMFKQFRSAEPKGTAEWIAQLKPVATTFIEKETAFQMQLAQLKAATTPAERSGAADKLRAIDPAFGKRTDEAVLPFKEEIAKHKSEIAKPPTSGIFTLVSRVSGKCLEVPGRSGSNAVPIKLADPGGVTHRWFRVSSVDPQTVKLVAKHSGKVLGVDGTAEGAKLQQQDDKNLPTQRWHLVSKGDAFFKLRNEGAGLFLTTASEKAENGTEMVLKSEEDTNAFQWKFQPAARPVNDLAGYNLGGGKGGFEFKDGVHTIRNTGRDIGGNSDQFGFAFREINGNFEMIARVTEITNLQPNTKVGLVVRPGLAGDDAGVALLTVSPQTGNPPKIVTNRVSHLQRLKKNTPMTESKVLTQPLPRWLKLVREGETVTSYQSADGTTWEQVASGFIEGFKGTAYAGLAVCSRKEDKEVTAKIDSVKVTTTPKK